jgi:hypothetical protein
MNLFKKTPIILIYILIHFKYYFKKKKKNKEFLVLYINQIKI